MHFPERGGYKIDNPFIGGYSVSDRLLDKGLGCKQIRKTKTNEISLLLDLGEVGNVVREAYDLINGYKAQKKGRVVTPFLPFLVSSNTPLITSCTTKEPTNHSLFPRYSSMRYFSSTSK